MIPVHCTVKHDPEAGTYGDCLRACIASVVGLSSDKVPHFFDDNCDVETANARVRHWMTTYLYAPFWVSFPGDMPLTELQNMMAVLNPDVYYILYCSCGGGDHVVICKGDKIVHNPSWINEPIDGPGSHGVWTILTITVGA